MASVGLALSALLLLGTVFMMASAQLQEPPKMSVPTLCYSQYFECLGQHKSYCVWEYYHCLSVHGGCGFAGIC